MLSDAPQNDRESSSAVQITTAGQPVVDQASDNEACRLHLEPVDATGGNTHGRNKGVRIGRGNVAHPSIKLSRNI